MEESAYITGLYDAEGEKSKHRIYLANSNRKIFEVALRWFAKDFRTKKSKTYIEIELPPKYKFKTPKSFRNYKIRKYVNRGLSKPCFKLRICFKEEVEKFKKLKQLTYKKMVREIEKAVFLEYPKTLKACRLSIRYLQGVFDGDGNIRQVAMNSLVPLLFIETFLIAALKAPNSYKVRNGYTTNYIIMLDNKSVLDRMKMISPFRYHLKRKADFGKLELKQKQYRGVDNIIKLLRLLDIPKTFSEIFSEANSECDNAVMCCVKAGLAKQYGNGTRHDPYRFVLTRRGSEFVKRYEEKRINYVIRKLSLVKRLAPA